MGTKLTRPDLFVHVGTHKTGTTAIQEHLAKFRAELAQCGILYPDTRAGTWKSMAGHHPLAHALASSRWKDVARREVYRHWLRRASRDMKSTIISAEPVYRHVLAPARRNRTDEWFGAHRAYLRRLAHWARGFYVRPIIYFRPPQDMAVSLFKEHVVRRIGENWHNSLPEFAASLRTMFDYPEHVAALEETLGPTEVRDYAAARRVGLEADFLSVVGVSGLPAPARPSVRTSPGNRATLWLSGLPADLSRRDHTRRVLFALRAGPEGPFHEPKKTTLWPDRAAFEAFVDRHRTAYELPFLADPVWPDLPPARWTAADDLAAETAFRSWETDNLDLLRRRETRRLTFYQPDPE